MVNSIIYLISKTFIYVEGRNIINGALNNYLGREWALDLLKGVTWFH